MTSATAVATGRADRLTNDQIIARMHRRRLHERLFVIAGYFATGICLLTLAALLIDLALDGIPALRWDFFTNFPSRFADKAGILSAWVGSSLVILVTAASGIPLGIAAAIYLEEYAPKNWFTDVIEINVNNLAGVPSIIYGLLALGLFIYVLGFGQSILTAGLTLALLILPIIIVATRESLRAVPHSMREASLALGATRWQTVSMQVLPYALPGIMTGTIIGLARAIGETAPLITIGALTFIAFLPSPPVTSEFPYISFQWLHDQFTVMPIQAFNWVSRPGSDFHGNAAACALILLLMTLLLNGLAIYLRYRIRKKIKW
jgi:phosphate transport system permease protein